MGVNWGSETTLVAYIDSRYAMLFMYNFLQFLIYISAYLHRLTERFGSSRQYHKLLHGQLIATMLTTIYHIKCRAR